MAQQAAQTLAEEHGVEAEVIDPRTLRPLDLDTILRSVQKTNRVVIVEEGWPHGGVGANLAALIQEQAFDYLDAPIERVTGADVHMPYSKRMEQAAIPHAEHVVSAALADARGEPSDGREIVMPRLSDSMEEGTVLRWLKSVGDQVAVGDELVEIETDKANMVYESDSARDPGGDRCGGGRHAAGRRSDRAGRGCVGGGRVRRRARAASPARSTRGPPRSFRRSHAIAQPEPAAAAAPAAPPGPPPRRLHHLPQPQRATAGSRLRPSPGASPRIAGSISAR